MQDKGWLPLQELPTKVLAANNKVAVVELVVAAIEALLPRVLPCRPLDGPTANLA